MSFYWVTLSKTVNFRGRLRDGFSVDAETEDKARMATNEALGLAGLRMLDVQINDVKRLPYPGEPRLNYKTGACPSFCLHPAKCAGSSSCPRNYACSE